jgi:hypothetical protein
MSVNISELGNLQPIDPVELGDTYVDAKESTFQLPEAGEYVLEAPAEFPQAAFGATQAGYLSAQIDPTVKGPKHEGYTVRFTKVSAKPFKRDGVTVSQAGDYLRACGYQGTLKTPQDVANAIATTAGTTYRAMLDWRAYNKRTGFSLEGMHRFPKTADGKHQSWVEDPSEKDENGKPVRVRANVIVKRFIAQGQ